MERETQPCLLGSFPLWLKQCLLFMASVFPPLTDSLQRPMYIHKDPFAAATASPIFGGNVPGPGWVGGEGGGVAALWVHELFVN